ncbi:MAG: S8 family peptidase [Dehalococcoidia bacterium]
MANHRLSRPGAVALVLFVVAVYAAAFAALGVRSGSAAPVEGLAAAQSTAGAELVGVIVRASDGTDAAVAAIERAGGSVERVYTIIPAVQAVVPAASLDALAGDAAIGHISLDASVELAGRGDDDGDDVQFDFLDPQIEDGTTEAVSVFPGVVGATDVWAAGITGDGVTIAIIDTGITEHGSDVDGRVEKRQSFVRGNKDRSGHGTFVSGVAAGDGEQSDGRYMGIAPDAELISVKVGSFDGVRIGDVIAGLEWIVEHREKHNIRIANLSFTSSVPESYLVSPLDAAVEQLWFHGIVVVVSAGNRGSDEFASDHPPANDPFVITVGAFTDEGTLDPSDDSLKQWSSRGLSHDGFAKPTIVAPGSRLIANVGDSSAALIELYPENRIGESYFRMGGTSAAAPVVSGVAALMLEAHPDLTPDEVKARLVASADPLPGSAAPQVDAFEAVFGADAGRANEGIQTSLWIDPATGTILDQPASLDSITWDSITWDSITWDSITWDSITWDSITWDSITWDSITWDSITWDSITWE